MYLPSLSITIIIFYINYDCTLSQILKSELDLFQGDREFDGVRRFEDIKICGTNETAFPFCSDPFQSPVNIITDETLPGREVECNSRAFNIQFDPPFDNEYLVFKKSNTIQLAAELVTIFDNPVIPISSTRNRVRKFCLEQIHFHWSIDPEVGGEHGIDGNLPPLEVHFVHYNCPRGSVAAVQEQYQTIADIEAARAQGLDVYELGVLSVDFEITDEANPAIDRILDATEIIEEQERINCTVRTNVSECFDPNATSSDLNPNPSSIFETFQNDIDIREILTDEIINGGYFTYEGSLTTPPCTSDVRWFVFNTLNHINMAQFLRWRNLFIPCNPDILIAPNGRPLQENINPVFRCKGDGFVNKKKDIMKDKGGYNYKKSNGWKNGY